MKYAKALELALENVEQIKDTELVNIEDALNRVVSKDIYALRALPPYNNSAMDGFAFKYSDINSPLKIIAKILAGDIVEPNLKQNECYKIMTGAKVPNDCDTIAPIEICEVSNGSVKVLKPIKKGSAIRLMGEELQKSSLIVKSGDRLSASKIALLASQGIVEVECFKELKIAIIATGSELKEPGEDATSDELYNINGINIKSHLLAHSIKSEYLGVLPDNLEESIEFFRKLDNYNIIITTGGVSVGDADFTKEALLQNGFKEIFHGIKVKPGHPTLMGKIGTTFVMAMPGNPLAAIMHIIILGLPIILKSQGAKDIFFSTKEAKISTTLKLKPNRVNIVLGTYKNGTFSPYKNNKYGSGMVTPLVESNAIALFNETCENITNGSTIKIVEFASILSEENFDYLM